MEHETDQTDESSSLLFDLPTPLGCNIRVTVAYWDIITRIKHQS